MSDIRRVPAIAMLLAAMLGAPGVVTAQVEPPREKPPEAWGDRNAGHFGNPGDGYFGDPSDGYFGPPRPLPPVQATPEDAEFLILDRPVDADTDQDEDERTRR